MSWSELKPSGLGPKKTSEWFYTAGRTVMTGLIASSVVSVWTWDATPLQSSSVGIWVSGPFWYAVGASIHKNVGF